jgi:hypothetical protein
MRGAWLDALRAGTPHTASSGVHATRDTRRSAYPATPPHTSFRPDPTLDYGRFDPDPRAARR